MRFVKCATLLGGPSIKSYLYNYRVVTMHAYSPGVSDVEPH